MEPIVAIDFVSVNVDYDNGITLQCEACAGLSKLRRRALTRALANEPLRKAFFSGCEGVVVLNVASDQGCFKNVYRPQDLLPDRRP